MGTKKIASASPDGRSVEDAIDIGEFPQLIQRYWHDAFRAAFRRDMPSLGAILHAVTEARNRVAATAMRTALEADGEIAGGGG